MLFVYQSKDMQRLYQRYGKHLVLLYVTYKTTRYSLQLHFVIVTQEETTCMLSKALQIIKSNFKTLGVIFSFSFLISLFSANTLFLYFGFRMILEHMFQEE